MQITGVKKNLVFVFIGLNCFLAGFFLSSDWAKEWGMVFPFLPFYLKGLFSLVCGIIVWTTGKKAFDSRDFQILSAAFVFTFLGDLSFIVTDVTSFRPEWMFLVTQGLYFLFQILCIFRYTRGWRSSDRDLKSWIIRALSGVFVLGVVAFFLTLAHSNLVKTQMVLPVTLYAILLSISVLSGINTLTLKAFPKGNAALIAVGMIAFFFGDIAEALKIAYFGTEVFFYAKKITWLFYGPALMLLALSGYRREGKKDKA
jgi:hypothetical protein